MFLIEVLIERKVFSLNRPFTYASDFDIEKGKRVLVSFHNSKVVGFVINSKFTEYTIEELYKQNGVKLLQIEDILDKSPIINDELFALAEHLSMRYVTPLITCLQTILPPSLKPKSSSFNAPKIKYDVFVRCIPDANIPKLTKKQMEVYYEISKYDKVLKNSFSSPIVKKLLEYEIIEEIKEETYRYSGIKSLKKDRFLLTKTQQEAFDKILSSDKQTILLKGVTGSGKTEIYLKLIEKNLERGNSSLFLVPEINLTPYMKTKVMSYFSDDVAILHSGLTSAQRYDEYRRIIDKNIKIVVGTRSAVFSPLKNLSLIIIDEEFSESYKNQDMPCYDTVEVAQYRISKNGGHVVLGTATPSVMSMTKAFREVYDLVVLDERYNEMYLPQTKIVNMNNRDNIVPGSSIIAKDLLTLLSLTLLKKEQAMILVNRRGYSNFSVCRECNTTMICPKCGKPLIRHNNFGKYYCHTCGYSIKFEDAKCDKCGSSEFYNIGFGTERIKDELIKYFPDAKIGVLDSDVGNNEKNIERILTKFNNHEIDVLIGTQMIGKGHDFENVTFVGVLNIDEELSLPSFRASENAFQLLTQTIGRAGRGQKIGSAIVETNLFDNYVIQIGSIQDYDLFYKKEIQIRKKLQNPPFYYVATIRINSNNKDNVERSIEKIYDTLSAALKEKIILRKKKMKYDSKGNFEEMIVLKHKSYKEVLPLLKELVNTYEINKSVGIIVDIDAIDY